MKFGFVANFTDYIAKFAAGAGFDGLEMFVGSIMEFARGVEVNDMTESDAARFMEPLNELGIGFTTLSCNPIHLHGDPAKRADYTAEFKKTLRVCKRFGTDTVVTNAFCDVTKSPSDNISCYKKVFSEYAKIADGEGVRIAIENCPHWHGDPPAIGNIAYSPEMWDALFDAVPDKAIGLQFDPSHLVWQGIDYLRAIKEYGSRIYAFHAKDTEILRDQKYRFGVLGRKLGEGTEWPGGWWRYRIPGFGEVDWKGIFNALYELDYSGPMVIEHEDPVFGGDRSENGLEIGPRTEKGLKLGLSYLKNLDII